MSQASAFQPAQALERISRQWDESIVPQLSEYIRIPAKSPQFEPNWQQLGLLDQALRHAAGWIEAQRIPGLRLEILQLPGRTPTLFFEVDGSLPGARQTVLFYGHLDKQPEATGWRGDLGPWTPKYEDGRLYGRGSADDGYAVYAAIAAIAEVKAQQLPHPRIVGIIETSEESGSIDLPPYIELLKPRLGEVGLLVCPDSGAGNYEQLWLTTSLRGNITGALKVDVLTEGIHSGDASGVVPSSFRVIRQLLDRLEDSASGRVLPAVFHAEIPAERIAQAQATAAVLGEQVYERFPWAGRTRPTTTDGAEALLRRTWQPTLSITGADGLPAVANAGNAIRPFTALKLSLRTPPLVDAEAAARQLKTLLESDPPHQASVALQDLHASNGWNAPAAPGWYRNALEQAGRALFGAEVGYIGQGGTIPLINLLGEQFPQAQMLVCGVLGPGSNAHGPNEFLHVPYAKKLTAAIAQVLAAAPG